MFVARLFIPLYDRRLFFLWQDVAIMKMTITLEFIYVYVWYMCYRSYNYNLKK